MLNASLSIRSNRLPILVEDFPASLRDALPMEVNAL